MRELNLDEINKNKEDYLLLLQDLEVDEEFVKYLDDNDFFTQPATSKFYGSYPGGLCEHCLKVYRNLETLNESLGRNFNQLSLIKLGLLHDLSKIGKYEICSKNVKEYSEDGSKKDSLGRFDWVSKLGYQVVDNSDREVNGNLGFESYLICKRFGIGFTLEEIVAMCNFDLVIGKNDSVNIYSLMSKHPLLTLLHMADISSAYLGEDYDL